MLRKKDKLKLLAAGLALGSSPTLAAPINLPWGIDLTPSVSTRLSYDDNVTSSNTDDIESWMKTVGSTVELTTDNGIDFYSLLYTAESTNYLSSRQDDYVDQTLTASAIIGLSSGASLTLQGDWQEGHEDRGTGFTQGISDQLNSPDTFFDRQVGLTFDYRPERNPVVFSASAGSQGRSYDEFLAQPGRDRTSEFAALSAGFRVGPQTTILSEINFNEIDFKLDTDGTANSRRGLDNRQSDYLVGIDWRSAKTELNLRVGERHKDFTAIGPENFIGPTWQLGLAWSPYSYSTFTLTSTRQTVEPRLFADFIDSKTNTILWDHNWSSSFSSSVSYSDQSDDYYGIEQVDQRKSSSVSLSYRARPWLTLQIGLNHSDQNSTDIRNTFERNVSLLGVTVSL